MKEYSVVGIDGGKLVSHHLGTLVAMMDLDSVNYKDQPVAVREPSYQIQYTLKASEIEEVRRFLHSLEQPLRKADQTRILTPIEINHA